MLSSELDKLLIGLAKVEMGLSRVYKKLSEKEYFRGPVRRFWSELSSEELMHARVFNKIREKAISDDAFEVEVDVRGKQLRAFVDGAKELIKSVDKQISESEAYNLCAGIEGELNEAGFLDGIRVSDEAMKRRLEGVKADTKKHRIVLINYARGIK